MTALDSTHTTAVDHGYHWQPMTSCPKGRKVQLLTRYGCAIYGTWTGKETIYTGWAPLPTRAPEGEAGASGPHHREQPQPLPAQQDRARGAARARASREKILGSLRQIGLEPAPLIGRNSRYMNFNEIAEFVEVAEKVEV